MRRGSLTERYQKCGKKSCACHHDPDARHGPYFSLTRAVGGRTKTVHLRAEEADVVRRQVEDGRAFRRELEDFWQECEKRADDEVEAVRAATSSAIEKGGSRRRSKARSKPRSRSS
jgi:hypothetical protein